MLRNANNAPGGTVGGGVVGLITRRTMMLAKEDGIFTVYFFLDVPEKSGLSQKYNSFHFTFRLSCCLLEVLASHAGA